MEKKIRISDDEKWQAVVNCDKSYDSVFFYAVKTTGIFCRPSCKSKTPVRENVTYFDSAENAIEKGFRTCKRCRPDKMAFEPDLELMNRAKGIFDVNYNKQINISHISKEFGVSTNHFIKLFKRYSGLTPTQYVTRIRVDKAVELLSQTDINVLDIAYTVGFKSLSNFYKCFKTQTCHTPNEYRRS